MELHNFIHEKRFLKRSHAYWKFVRNFLICLCITVIITKTFYHAPSVSAAPTDLKVYAEAPSFARLDIGGDQDPTGWFYQAILYNPTSTDIVITGLRWWYNSSVDLIDTGKPPFDAKCYDKRYFSALPSTFPVPMSKREIRWEYSAGSISITVPAKKMVLTWIEVPTKSYDNLENTPATYYVEAYVANQWISSPIYLSHGGANQAISTVFRADFNLTTDPNTELQNHPNPEWLFKEDRVVVAQTTARVRLIPVASGKGAGINLASINITLPSSWSYVPDSWSNPYGEIITYFSVDGKDRLAWILDRDISVYSTNQSMAQNYIEFNVTAPSTPGIYNFSVNSIITSVGGRLTTENQSIYVVVRKPPTADLTLSPLKPLINQPVTFNASSSYDLDGTIVNYSWDFGDSQTATGMIVSHTYTILGNYMVTLTVIDNDGLNGTKLLEVYVRDSPVASFTFAPSAPIVNETIIFNASLSTPNDGSITDYLWDFGDGNITTVYEPIIIHSYDTAGSYTVSLRVFDNDGYNSSSSETLTVVVHDLAVLSVLPSATEVKAGQLVNVTVVVKNKGTTSETFNVTVYCNNTKLETQHVVNLAPDTEIILTFAWNTTGSPEGSVFTIRAETSQILGEIDTADNNRVGNSVKISLTSSTSRGFWDTVLPYAIPIGAVIVPFLLFAVFAIWRRAGKSAGSLADVSATEFQPFVDMAGGELPDAFSVMIVGDASAGKSVFCQQLTHRYLTEGKPCIYVTYDSFPEEIRENMKNFGWDISSYEQNGTFAFVDCYSSTAGKASQEKYSVKQPFALSELGIVMSITIGALNQKSVKVFLDSTVPLFTRLELTKVVEFLQDRSAQIKGENGIFFFTVGKGTLQQEMQSRLEELVDCIIELEVLEEKGKTVRKMRIRKLRGRKFSDQCVPFQIDLKKGLVLSVSK